MLSLSNHSSDPHPRDEGYVVSGPAQASKSPRPTPADQNLLASDYDDRIPPWLNLIVGGAVLIGMTFAGLIALQILKR